MVYDHEELRFLVKRDRRVDYKMYPVHERREGQDGCFSPQKSQEPHLQEMGTLKRWAPAAHDRRCDDKTFLHRQLIVLYEARTCAITSIKNTLAFRPKPGYLQIRPHYGHVFDLHNPRARAHPSRPAIARRGTNASQPPMSLSPGEVEGSNLFDPDIKRSQQIFTDAKRFELISLHAHG
ncbi:hypothetical protein EVAR_25127_1 [Eumeta japonica]|uniref:Uncharacterized protein n=1 Tax=Eumeta variegata TaxID=151549 RepID=A0A4C1XJ83_EUMVA|nr:hypothetical protein EVAR_25127_1 [Eumeta japonica]